jgi:hypothetical protein
LQKKILQNGVVEMLEKLKMTEKVNGNLEDLLNQLDFDNSTKLNFIEFEQLMRKISVNFSFNFIR